MAFPRAPLRSLTLALALTSLGFAQTLNWELDLLATPPPTWSGTAVVAVEDSGLVVGNCYVSSLKRAWVAGPSLPLQLLPLPTGASSGEAYDMNASGEVAGRVLPSAGGSLGVLWRPGPAGYDVVLLPVSPGGHAPFDARGINDAGEVVGKLGILGGSYHWTAAGGLTQLPTSVFPVAPIAINEQRQIVGDSYRMDLDTLVLEDLGDPTGTSYSYFWTEFLCMNDAGECGGFAVVATSLPPYLAVRFTDGPSWQVFSSFPWTSASTLSLSAFGDAVYQLGAAFGKFVYVEGFGSLPLQDTLAPAFSHWDLTGSFPPAISSGALLACTAANTVTGEAGIVVLTPLGFEDLAGASRGALGDPVLGGFGSLAPGAPVRVRLASAAPNSGGYLLLSTSSSPLPLFGGTLHANPRRRGIAFQTDALGRWELSFAWPSVPPGTPIYLQALVADPSAVGPLVLSNGLRGVTH